MNLRLIHPRRLRLSLFYRLSRWFPNLFATPRFPAGLDFADVTLSHLLPTDHLHRQILHTGFYEEDLSRWLSHTARTEGGLLVDVGANIGYFTALWLAGRTDNTAHCFEPSPRNLQLLAGNLAQPKLQGRHTIHPTALSRESGRMNFDPGPEEQTGWGGLDPSNSSLAVSVDVRRLDDVLPEARITVLKIDCEGADPWVIEGASKLLERQLIRHVVFENNPSRSRQLGTSTPKAIELLKSCGYKVDPLSPRSENEFHAYVG